MKIKKSIFILMVIVLITILGTVLYKGEKYNLIIAFHSSDLPRYCNTPHIKRCRVCYNISPFHVALLYMNVVMLRQNYKSILVRSISI